MVQTVVRSCYRPVLLLALEPMCLCLCLFSALLLGILYLFFGAFQLVFGNVYGFSLWQRGCSFLGLLVGIAFAIMMDPIWRRLYERLERKHQAAVGRDDDFQPEWRLPAGEFCLFPLLCCTRSDVDSHRRRARGDKRAVYFCVDHLPLGALDSTDHWERAFWGWVGGLSQSRWSDNALTTA